MSTASVISPWQHFGCKRALRRFVCLGLVVSLSWTGFALAEPPQQGSSKTPPERLKTLNIREMTIGELVAFLSYSGNIQAVASQDAARKTVSIFLQDVSAQDALEAICRSAGLVYRPNAEGVSFILTQQEFSASRGLYNDEVVETIQLRYATAADIGESLRNLFADRLVWIEPSEDMGNARNQIDKALSRMDLLSEYEEFDRSGDSDDKSNNRRNDNTPERTATNSRQTRSSGGTQDFAMLERYRALLRDQSLGETSISPAGTRTERNDARFGVVFVSAFTSANMLLLRSTDSRALEQIKSAVNGLDRPTPQVLLEVKVLELDLGDGQFTGVDWFWQAGDGYAGSNTWDNKGLSVLPEDSGSGGGGLESAIVNNLTAATSFSARTAVIGVLSDRLVARMRFMESQGRLTQLATPTLLVADDEASRVFIGSQSQFLKKIARSAVVISEGGQTSGGELTPELVEQSIGMNLLITPRIHADRSVTLRVLQEDTDFGEVRAINYGGAVAVEVQDIQHRSVVSTIVAHHNNWVIIGGLLRESVTEKESGVPVLKDIPWLGQIFKSTGKSHTRSELIIMIRPMVLVAPGDDLEVTRELLERLSKHPAAADVLENRPVNLTKPQNTADNEKISPEAVNLQKNGHPPAL